MRHSKRDTPKGQSYAREGRDKREGEKEERKGRRNRPNSLMEAGGAEVHSSESTVITQDIEQRDADCAKL